MPLSNYPGGFNNGLVVRGMPVLNSYGGDIFWVDSGAGSNGNPGTFSKPFATLDYAVGKTTASNGDYIMVKPGHTETLSAASAVKLDVAGINVVGLGTGSLRPTFTFDTGATTDIAISAANVYLTNMVMSANYADIVRAFAITAKYATLDRIEFVDTATNMNWLTPIKATSTTNNNADGLTVVQCRWSSPDAAGLEFIEVNADIKYMSVRENYVAHEGTASPLVLMATGKDMQYVDIRDNFLSHKMTSGLLLVNDDTSANSGIIAHNRVGHADVTSTHDLGIDALGCRLFDNLSVSTDSLSGFVLPAIDVNS